MKEGMHHAMGGHNLHRVALFAGLVSFPTTGKDDRHVENETNRRRHTCLAAYTHCYTPLNRPLHTA